MPLILRHSQIEGCSVEIVMKILLSPASLETDSDAGFYDGCDKGQRPTYHTQGSKTNFA